MNFLDMPMGSIIGRDRVVGKTEWGAPIYQSQLGDYYYEEAPLPPTDAENIGSILDAKRNSQPAPNYNMTTTRQAPEGMTQPGIMDAAKALWGMVGPGITAPGRALRGEVVTNGDTLATALDWAIPGAAMAAPEGALRSGAMRTSRAAPDGRAIDVIDRGGGLFKVAVGGEDAGSISLSKSGNFVHSADLAEQFRGKRIGPEAYNAIEEMTGNKLAPSPLGLSENARPFWRRRLSQMSPSERADMIRKSYNEGVNLGVPDRDVRMRLYEIGGPEALDAIESLDKPTGIRAYHASPRDFTEFKPSEFRGATFLAPDKDSAIKGASAGRNEYLMDTATQADAKPWNVYEAEIDPKRIAGLSLTPDELKWFDGLPSEFVGDDLLADAWKGAPSNFQYWDDVYDAEKVGDAYKYTKKPEPPSISYEDAAKSGRDIYGRPFSHYSQQGDEAATAKRVLESGMGGWLVQDEAGLSLAVADPTIAQILSKNGEGITKPTGIRAYHGSPHDFDKFSLDKIGTGEGAQAYGHGLYFAEAEDVARGYRDALTNFNPSHIENMLMQKGISADAANSYARWATETGGRKGSFDDFAKIISASSPSPTIETFRAKIRAELPKIREATESAAGHMYEVNINANPDDFLDWDAPLSEQPQKIRDVLAKFNSLETEPGQNAYMRAGRESHAVRGDDGRWGPGGNSYDESLAMVGGDKSRVKQVVNSTPDLRTEALREAGIPGIKYKDAGSRGTEGGTRNYVVFDDNLIDIVRKYGLAGLTLGGAMGLGKTNQQDADTLRKYLGT